ncbi:MAG: class I SAM-dependent methyltransferase [Gammaproteobacteria bacterium]|nr:class I SAM-dependent methyltransferase [Gammaproteobacteria bacterium]
MSNEAENKVSNFYNTVGWEENNNVTEDANRWEDLRKCAEKYVSKCRLRLLKHIPLSGKNIIDMASGPIQYPEYLEYSKNFNKRYCVDLSDFALEKAKEKIQDHGVFLCGSFFDLDFEQDFFDCALSLHTIYHMEKTQQEKAVRKLIHITKPGKPVIIIYSNPRTLLNRILTPIRHLSKSMRRLRPSKHNTPQDHDLYFYAHPIQWWDKFANVATVQIRPWRSFAANQQKLLFPNNRIGQVLFDILYYLEEKFPVFFYKNFQYPMIILTKK